MHDAFVNTIRHHIHAIAQKIIHASRSLGYRLVPIIKPRFITARQQVQTLYQKFIAFVQTWIEQFKHADTRGKIRLAGIPLGLFLGFILCIRILPLFFPPEVSVVFPADKSTDVEQTIQIEIGFDRAVNKKSVEKSFVLTPQIEGRIAWQNNQSMTFIPTKPLPRGTPYTIELRTPYVSSFFIPTLKKLTTTFTTIGNPRIVVKAPELEAPETKTPITLVFSQPMVALTTATASAALEQILTVTPSIAGSGRWLGTTAYQFIPDANYRQATTYKVQVKPDLMSVDGYPLDQNYAWEFSGIKPRVVNVGPKRYSDMEAVVPTASVSAYFNLKPDPKVNFNNFFVITDTDNTPVNGSILLQDKALHFRPSRPWPRGKEFKALIKKGFLSKDGPNGMDDDYRWSFTTTPPLAVTYTYPKAAETSATDERDISLQFNTPISKSMLTRNMFRVDPPLIEDPQKEYLTCSDPCSSITIHGKLERLKKYTVTVDRTLTDIYGSTLENPYILTFTTGPHKTDVSFVPSSLQVVIVNQAMPIDVTTRTINSDTVSYTLSKISEQDFLNADTASSRDWDTYQPKTRQDMKTWQVPIQKREDDYVQNTTTLTDANNSPLQSGYYFLTASIPDGKSTKIAILSSRSTVTVKKGTNTLLAWATDQSTGQTVPDMTIRAVNAQGAPVDQGKTNKDGIAVLKIPEQRSLSYEDRGLYIFGTKGNDVTVTATRWSHGISNWDFGLPYYASHDTEEYPIHLVTDRPLYRPGQEVMYKGILRKDTDGAFALVSDKEEVEVTIKDAESKTILTEKKKLTSFGTFSGKLTLNKEGNLGMYTIQAQSSKGKEPYRQLFQVEEYRRQEFKVGVKPLKDDFVSGEHIQFTINASYYFGAPIKNASAFYTVKSEDFFFHWDKNPQYEFGQPDSYWYRPWSERSASNDKSITESNAVTDAQGNIDISIPFNMTSEKQSKRIIVDAAVTDINNHTVGASQELFVHKSEIYTGVKPRDYVNTAGKDTAIDVVTVNPRGNEVGNRSVTGDIYRITWVSTREQDTEDGAFYYRNKPVENLVTTVSATTDERGYGSMNFVPPKGGTYKVVTKSADDHGNILPSSTYFWVSGDEFESTRENHDRIPLITDKYNYQQGDQATLFISTPFGADTAKTLVTFERNSVLDYHIVDIDEKHTTDTFRINEKMVPNVFVSAVLMRGSTDPQKPPEFKVGYTELRASDARDKLVIDIQTDRERYQPRETVHTVVHVKDAQGHPRKAELSLALVDRALLDLATISLVDPFGFFYEPRALGVETSQSLTFSLNRINLNVTSDSKGGDGDTQSGLSTKRMYFPETDYWNAHITTNDQGVATVDIPLADNLTTWKFTAVANADTDAFGHGTKEILATKDVLLRPVTPRFLAIGDQAHIGAIVVNKTEADVTLNVSLKATGLTIHNPTQQQVVIKKGEQSPVLWNTTAMEKTNATIQITARTTNATTLDDIEVSLPIVAYHTPENTATAGTVENQKTEAIALPPDIVPNRGDLTVNLSSSILGSTLPILSYLIDYPYGCTEQTTSRFYPAINLSILMKANNMKTLGSYNQERLTEVINLGIQKLQHEQKSDGGWGWWTDSRYSDPYLSAYAYQALKEANDAGFGGEETTLTQAESYLLRQLGSTTNISLDVQSFILQALSSNKKTAIAGYIDTVYDNRIRMSTSGKAYLLLAMYRKNTGDKRITKLKDELVSRMKKTATGIHWEDKPENTFRVLGDDISTTATVFETLILTDPKSPFINDIARYFQATLKNENWRTTRTTSAVLHAIVSYTKLRGDLNAQYTYTVNLNGTPLATGTVKKNDIENIVTIQKPMEELKLSTDNNLVFTKKDKGNLYYTANLHYFLPYTDIAPLERGVTILRSYENADGQTIQNNMAKAGELLRVRLTLVVNATRRKLIVEDKLPAGIEAYNENLKGSMAVPVPEKKPDLGTLPLYYDRKETRDDRVVYFIDQLSPGVYEATYMAHATTAGNYHRPPAQAYEMYMPDVMGHTDGGWFEVGD